MCEGTITPLLSRNPFHLPCKSRNWCLCLLVLEEICNATIRDIIKLLASRETLEESGVIGLLGEKLGEWIFKSRSQEKFNEGSMLGVPVVARDGEWPETVRRPATSLQLNGRGFRLRVDFKFWGNRQMTSTWFSKDHISSNSRAFRLAAAWDPINCTIADPKQHLQQHRFISAAASDICRIRSCTRFLSVLLLIHKLS